MIEKFEEGQKNKKQELLDRKSVLEQEILKIDAQLKELDHQNNKGLDKDEADIESKEGIYCSLGADRKLHKSDNPDCAFKVFNINGNTAEFKYCGGPVNLDYFNGVARFANNPYNIQNIKEITTVEPGVVEKDNNEWVVKKPLKIKFE